MKAIGRAIYVEVLKIRHTLAFWLALIAPLVTIFLQMAIIYQSRSYYSQGDFESVWLQFGQQALIFWALLVLPLFVTLETALIGNLEHKSQQWKHLFALPVPKGAIYTAKQFSGMAVIGLSMASLVGLTALGGILLRNLVPGVGFESPVPWGQLLKYCGITYLGSWLIISIHTWISLRWHNFAVASAAGIVMTLIGVVVVQSDFGPFYPWSLPGMLSNGFIDDQLKLTPLLIGSIGGLIAAFTGGWDITHRDVL